MTDLFHDPVYDASLNDDVGDPDIGLLHETMPDDTLLHFDASQPDVLAGSPHWHLIAEHNAGDSNANGLSDAVEMRMGLDPTAYNGQASDLLALRGLDTDLDGLPDDIETAVGTDPADPDDFPMIVESHHFPEGSELNLPGVYDVPMPQIP